MRKRYRWSLTATCVLVLSSGLIWIFRTPLVTGFVDRTLVQQRIPARYTIDHIGLRTQRLTNVRIGPANNPDLVAREIELQIGLGLSGPVVTSVKARGLRLNARWTGKALSLGSLDRLLPARDPNVPFELPDMAVDLADATIAVSTPWGPVSVEASGHGALRGHFAGSASIRAPQIGIGACQGHELSAEVVISMISGTPRATGPAGIGTLVCPGAAIALQDVRLGVTATSNRRFSQWTLGGGVRTGRGQVPMLAARSLVGRFDMRSTPDRTVAAEWSMRANGAVSDYAEAQMLRMNGSGRWDGGTSLRVNGNVTLDRGRVTPAMTASLTRVHRIDDALPFGPIARRLGSRLSSASRDFSITGDYAVQISSHGTTGFTKGAVITTASGARMVLSGRRALAWSTEGGLSFDSIVTLTGGGLPEGRIVVAKQPGRSAVRGEARFAPYAASGAAVAFAPIRFDAAPGGTTRFATRVSLSGPVSGGAVDRLAIPVAGEIAADGNVRISGECRSLSWQGLQVGTVSFDRSALRICGQGGGTTLAFGPGGTRGGLSVAAFALSGHSGASPMRITSSGGALSFANPGFALRDVGFSVGSGDSATRLDFAKVEGAQSDHGLDGTIDAGAGRIGTVPFLLSDANGRWQFSDGRLDLQSTLAVADADADDRFQPLRSDSITLALQNGQISASGVLREAVTGTTVADLTVRHDLSTSIGDAHFHVPTMTFSPDALQPEAISRLTLGVIANVTGQVSGEGALEWTPDGISSSGDFRTAGLDLAAAFGPVKGLAGSIHFSDLLNLATPSGQRVTIASVNPGIDVVDGQIVYQLLSQQRVQIESGLWPFAGGTLRLRPALLDFDARAARHLTFEVSGVDAALFLQRYDYQNISATGTFDGVLPTVFDADGGRVENGLLTTRAGGTLAYVGELSNRDLGLFGNLAYQTLKSLTFDRLTIGMNGRIDGEVLTEVNFTGLGQGESGHRGFLANVVSRTLRRLPIRFSIRIAAPFRQLLTSARGLYDPTLLIDQNLPALLRAQQAAEAESTSEPTAAAPGPASPVQPPESEDKP